MSTSGRRAPWRGSTSGRSASTRPRWRSDATTHLHPGRRAGRRGGPRQALAVRIQPRGHPQAERPGAKGVDISLTKDMLVQAFLGNYDIAVLVAADGDYLPVVEEVKRLGK